MARIFSTEKDQELGSRHQSGETVMDLSRIYGVSPLTVRRAIVRAIGDIHTRRGGRKRIISENDRRAVVDNYRDGKSRYLISQETKIGHANIDRILLDAGCVLETRLQTGDKHYGWKGGRYMGVGGYMRRYIGRDHWLSAYADKSGTILEHRLVMADSLGRPLEAHEIVHHINGDKADNRLENLQIRVGFHGKGVVAVCADCGSHHINYEEL